MPDSSAASAVETRGKILIVDDEELIRESLETLLELRLIETLVGHDDCATGALPIDAPLALFAPASSTQRTSDAIPSTPAASARRVTTTGAPASASMNRVRSAG